MRVITAADLDSINTIENSDVFYASDVVDQSHIDIILKKGCPKYFVSDLMTSVNFQGIHSSQWFGLPLWIENTTKNLVKVCEFDNTPDTVCSFNFLINKKSVNRYLCIKLIEWFDLKKFNYTWSAVDQRFDCTEIISEFKKLKIKKSLPLNQQLENFILAPINLEKRFIELLPDDPAFENIDKSMVLPWISGLDKIVLSSAISLITETVYFQKASCFTEKTVFSALGLTFPIWVGGYNQANEWKRIGFDIFEDIIDHSYQCHDTLVERCYYAIYNNLELLRNLDKCAELRKSNLHRLLKNRDLLIENHLGKFNDIEISKFPRDLQSAMPKILPAWRPELR